MTILDGKEKAALHRDVLSNRIQAIVNAGNRPPKLTIILVGDDEASRIFVEHKIKACQQVGIDTELTQLRDYVSQEEIISHIATANADKNVDGILLQLPLPAKFNEEECVQAIAPDKDADGLHYGNQGKLFQGHEGIYPSAAAGVMRLLRDYDIDVRGKHAVVVGASNLVGKPLALILLNNGATVTICHKDTHDLAAHTRTADVLVSATGHQAVITREMIKPGAVVVDVGIVRDHDSNKLVGDVDFGAVSELCSFITPVPGGVGPMTILTLLENVFKLYRLHLGQTVTQ